MRGIIRILFFLVIVLGVLSFVKGIAAAFSSRKTNRVMDVEARDPTEEDKQKRA